MSDNTYPRSHGYTFLVVISDKNTKETLYSEEVHLICYKEYLYLEYQLGVLANDTDAVGKSLVSWIHHCITKGNSFVRVAISSKLYLKLITSDILIECVNITKVSHDLPKPIVDWYIKQDDGPFSRLAMMRARK
jgi:hypothetical protein